MANWFKLYETDLDESRLRYAMTQLPEIWPVWTGLLIECCKHRGATIRWGKNEQELFGFSDRLKISIGKVNSAIKLLESISYISLGDNDLKVLKWNEKQDDYLARKSRGYWTKRSEAKKLTVNHSDSHIEERRGEEIEIRREDTKRGASRFAPPELAAVKLQAAKIGLSDIEAEKFFNYYTSNGWKVGKNPMRSWTHALSTWKLNGQNYGQTSSKIGQRPNPRNAGVIIGPTDYSGKPRFQRERDEAERARLAKQVAANADHPSGADNGAAAAS